MTTVTVLSGERTIGGTQIVVEEDGYRLLFDCGLAFEPSSDPFAFVRHRPGLVLADLLSLGLAPDVPGLYAAKSPHAIAHGPLTVALSHAHLDHTHLVGFVSDNVPLYASPATARIVRAHGELGVSSATLRRPIREMQSNEPFEAGPMRVRLIEVDHDVCGACGMIIETADGTIAYSGDLRLHGSQPTSTLQFCQAARAANARLLILEGTRLWPSPENAPDTPPDIAPERVEADVAPDVLRALREVPGQIGLILQSPENGDRVRSLSQAAAAADRLYITDLEGLALTYAALGDDIGSPYGVYIPSEYRLALDEGRPLPDLVAEALRRAPRVVQSSEMKAQPGSFLLRLGFAHFADLLDIVKPGNGGIVITSNGYPLGRFDPAYSHLEWWAARLDLRIFDASSTGHAHPRDLQLVAALSGASTVMSIHSRHPELMPVPAAKLMLPDRGRTYHLSDLPT